MVPEVPQHLQFFRRILLAVAAFGGVLVVGLVAEHVSRISDSPSRGTWEITADLSLTGFRMEEVGADGPHVQLSARQARLTEDNHRLLADGLSVTFFDRGSPAATLSARSGEVNLDDNSINVSGPPDNPARVELLSGGITVLAPGLTWDPASRTVRSVGAATLSQQQFTATGNALEANVDSQTVTLKNGVKVQWQP